MSKMEQIISLLKSQNTLVLATSSADSAPYATPLFYVTGKDLELYWFSSLSSQHSRNLKRSPYAAGAVFCATDDWKHIRGVQMRGEATLVRDMSVTKRIRSCYAERFQLNVVLRAVMNRSGLFVFRPFWLRYLDNTKRFGYKFETSVPFERRVNP